MWSDSDRTLERPLMSYLIRLILPILNGSSVLLIALIFYLAESHFHIHHTPVQHVKEVAYQDGV